MKKAIVLILLAVSLNLTGCIPLLLGGVIGYEYSKSKQEDRALQQKQIDAIKAGHANQAKPVSNP